MANRRPQNNGRRVDYGRHDRGKNFGRPGVSPWQGGGPGAGIPNLLPLGGGSTEATLALANNLINNLLQSRQQTVPSLLDMPIRRDFVPDMGRFDRGGYNGPNRMGNQGNFRRSGNYNRPGDRMNNRKPFRPSDGQRNQNKTTPKKEADSKAKPVKESTSEKTEGETNESATVKTEAGQEKKDVPKTRYDDIHPQLLKCHICNKSMWDGRSFENHLSGRAHSIMMQKTAESYALTADTMRQEFKIREMKRTRKTGQATPRDFYCAMCDMYAADGAAHRTTVGHRKLKKYLHPACTSCHKEMPTRIELDEHRLTAEHLKNVHDKQEITSKPKPEVMVISTLSMEQSYVRDDRQRRYKPREEDKDDSTVKKEPTEGEGDQSEAAPKAGEDGEKQPETNEEETKVLDYKEEDDLTHVTADMIPTYKRAAPVRKTPVGKMTDARRKLILDSVAGSSEGAAGSSQDAAGSSKDATGPSKTAAGLSKDEAGPSKDTAGPSSTAIGVGRSFLSPFSCVQCRLCHKLLDSQETAEVHLKTWRHHQLYVRALREKSGNQVDGSKRPNTEREESGNFKRRKTSPEHDEENEEEHDADVKEEPRNEVEADAEAEPQAEEGTEEAEAEIMGDGGDWESQVDEILQDEAQEQNGDQDEQPEDPQPEEAPAEEPVKEKSPPPTPEVTTETKPKPKPKATPRGRGRGRGRARY